MVSWGTLQPFIFFIGPWLIPRALAWYRSIRNRPTSQIRPLPTKCSYALALLFSSGLLAFLSTLPLFAAPNIFRLTQSRLHTSGGVLLTRLAALRNTTAADEKLRKVFDAGGLDARLLYAQYGPHVVVDNPLAEARDVDAAQMFLLYAAPSILLPHLLHVFVLGIATSGVLSGKEGAKWRTMAVISGLVLAVVEMWVIGSYDNTGNARSARLNEIDFVYWKMQVWRGLGVAGVDAVLGWMIWLQATGRAFISPPTPGERVAEHAVLLEALMSRTRNIGLIRNGIVRDAGSRNKVNDYWVKEGEVMKDILEEPEVLEAQRTALKRVDPVRVGREAESYLEPVFGELERTQR